MNFNKYRRSRITLEIRSLMPEKFINLLWRNNVSVKNIIRKDISTIVLNVKLKDYGKIEEIAKKTNTKIKITKRKGFAFFFIKIRKRVALIMGVIIFVFITYYLSTFIWRIDVVTDHVVPPYEVRRQLGSYGVIEGINKKDIDIYKIEEKLIDNNEDIMWAKVRLDGSRLVVTVSERQIPPNINKDDEPCDLIAKNDGEIIRIYTTSGTAVVKPGDIIKRGTVLVKGEQGKEGSEYEVTAKGKVVARTFYEEVKNVKLKSMKRERTGNKVENIYIKVNNKKIFVKKNMNKFEKYDKIEDNKGPIVRVTYYEVKEKEYKLDEKKLVKETTKELSDKITINFDQSVKVVDKVVDCKPQDDELSVRVLLIVEEDIAVPEKLE